MYSVTVREHIMIAHSLRGEVFGPAQQLHGATYLVDVEFRRSTLDADGIVVDIGRAMTALRDVLGGLNYRNLDDEPALKGQNTTTEFRLNYRNLDDEPALKGQNTTTEFLARVIFDRVAAAISRGNLGAGGRDIESIRVTLHESHVASASFDGRV